MKKIPSIQFSCICPKLPTSCVFAHTILPPMNMSGVSQKTNFHFYTLWPHQIQRCPGIPPQDSANRPYSNGIQWAWWAENELRQWNQPVVKWWKGYRVRTCSSRVLDHSYSTESNYFSQDHINKMWFKFKPSPPFDNLWTMIDLLILNLLALNWKSL